MNPSEPEHYCPSCDSSFGLDVKRCPTDGTDLITLVPEDEEEDLTGVIIEDRFEILELIGQGGMGRVYLARQLSVGREVAVKVITGKVVHQRSAVKRFMREAKLTSQIQHPNSVMVLDFGQRPDGMLYLVMERIKGCELSDELARLGRLPAKRVLDIGAQICDALDAAHRLEIIHRDLKPSNIILVENPHGRDRVKVLDFGLAKSLAVTDESTVTRVGSMCGTPAYIAPEAACGHQVDARADLYSLGVVLYELFSGRRPFDGDGRELLMQHINTPPPPIDDAPAVVWNVLLRLLAKKPDERYASAAIVAEILKATMTRITGQMDAFKTSDNTSIGDLDTAAGTPTPVGAPVADGSISALVGQGGSTPASTPPINIVSEQPRRARTWLPWMLTAVAVCVVVLMWLMQPNEPETSPPATDNVTATVSAVASPVTSMDLRRGATEEVARRTRHSQVIAHPEMVRLMLVSDPPTEVRLDGQVLGKTPYVVEMPWGTDPVSVVFQKAGRKRVTRQVVPDRWQKIRVQLPRKKQRGPSFIVPD